MAMSLVFTSVFLQKHPRGQIHPWETVATLVPSAVGPRNLEHSVVALVVVLGSRNVEKSVTQSLIIHGSRASRLAKVSGREFEFALCIMVDIVLQNVSLITVTYGVVTVHIRIHA